MKKHMAAAMAAGILAGTMLLTGCSGSINPDAVLVKINGGEDQITLGYGNFAARYRQADYDMYYIAYFGDDVWSQELYSSGTTFEDEVKANVLDDLEEQYLCEAHAADYDVALTDDEETVIADTAARFIEDNSDEAIEQMGATEDYVRQMLTYEAYQQRVQDAVKEETEASVSEEESLQRTFSYVVFSTAPTTDEDGNSVELSEEEIAVAEEAAGAAAQADDFEAAVEEAGETLSSYSYTASEDPAEDEMMDEAVIEAANGLSEGEISDVIEVEGDGYYVLRLDSEHDEDATEAKVAELEEEQRADHYDEVLQGWKDETDWDVDESAWKKVRFDTLFEQAQTQEESSTSSSSE